MDSDLISLTHVHLTVQVSEGLTNFSCTSTLSFLALCPVDRVAFHARGLPIKGVKATHNKRPVEVVAVSEPNEADEVWVTLGGGGVGPGRLTLLLSTSGAVSDTQLHGLFRCHHTGSPDAVLLTHFEPAFARGTFACVDDFAVRPRWTLELRLPTSLHALANMPLAVSKTEGRSTQISVFAETPPMPAYLLGFHITAQPLLVAEGRHPKGSPRTTIPVRVQYPKGNAEASALLPAALRGLSILEDYFGLPYGLPKLDIVFVPRLMLGGMENWGLIFLNAADTTSQGKGKKASEKLVELLMHELAHQWIGNLVGFPFWIKEGVCCYLEELVGDLVTGRRDRPQPSGRTPAGTEDVSKASVTGEASQLFTGSTYQRSQAAVSDSVRILGPDEFRDRLRHLLAQNFHGFVTEEQFLAHFAP